MFYLRSKNKDPDQLRLCYGTCKKQVFSCFGSFTFCIKLYLNSSHLEMAVKCNQLVLTYSVFKTEIRICKILFNK